MAVIFGTILQQDMDNFAKDWNEHPIRPNHNVNSPSGRPSDIYDMPSLFGERERSTCCRVVLHNYIIGVEDKLMPIDSRLWARCMLEESITPPPLCPSDLAEDIEFFMRMLLGLTLSDITHANCKRIYVLLTNFIETIV